MPPTVLLSEYLKSDRQWPRRLRIEHARLMLKAGLTVFGDGRFWRDVLKANGVAQPRTGAKS